MRDQRPEEVQAGRAASPFKPHPQAGKQTFASPDPPGSQHNVTTRSNCPYELKETNMAKAKETSMATDIPDDQKPWYGIPVDPPPAPVYYLTPTDPESTTPIPWSPGDPIPEGAEAPGLLESSLPQFPVWGGIPS